MKKLFYGLGMNDYDGIVRGRKFYEMWYSMLCRCYSEKYPSYIGCSVCEEWLSLVKFKEWFDENYVDGWQLDKDLIHKQNKIYSADTCSFVPSKVNTFITESGASNSAWLIGTSPHHSGKGRFLARVGNLCGGRITKVLPTELEAHMFWKETKHKLALTLIEEYPMMDTRAKDALSTRYSGDGVYCPLH